MPTVDYLRQSRDLAVEILNQVAPQDWSTTLTTVEFDVRHMCAHMSQTGFWYSIDLCATDTDLVAVVPEVKVESDPADLVRALHVGVELLSTVVAAASPETRGFHPFGQADASAFAAMGCDELLVHTYDIATSFDLTFEPPGELADAVLARLFPGISGDEDPWTLLLWANGRLALPGRPQRTKWKWHCAPLAEWDGQPV